MPELFAGIFTAFGLSASAGLKAYIPLLIVGLLARYTDLIALSKPWDTLANPWIILMLCVLVIIEMLADKVPAVNHVNDLVQTVIRPAAGAIAFAASAQVVTDVHPAYPMATDYLSMYTDRYNLFELEEGVDLTLPTGQYTYKVYESSDVPTSVSDTSGDIIEEGRMVVELSSITSTIYD